MLSACPDNNKSNRIIVTTASNRVTNTICQGNGPVYKMRPLDKNSAKHLLGKKVMFPRNVDRDRLMTMILETCEYLPLAISNMGDYMRSLNKTWDYDECEKACTNIGSLLDNNEIEAFRGMKHVVNRSYTRLSVNAKACLLSVNIYFKNLVIENHVINDHVIKGKPLIRRLLAERLISSSPSSSVDVLANECFTELIEQNFIVPVEVSISGQVKRFRVNRMMPLFIRDKGYQENYVTRIDIRPGQDVEPLSQADITRLYLKNSSSESARIGGKASTTHVRLLTYHGEASKVLMDFNNYMFLRVLILENCGNMKNEHLHTVCSRPVLRYLSIRGNQDVTMLPANIVNMRSLETLDTRDTKVNKIPMDVILLPVLLHLFGKFQIILKNKIMFPKNSKVQKVAKFISNENPLSNLFEGKNDFPIESSKLQTLAGFLIDEIPYFVTLLPRIPMLSKVRILCGQTAPNEMVTKDLLKSLKSCLKEVKDGNSPLHSLTIDFHGRPLNFLDNLEIEPPCLLRSLKLCGKLTRLPRFILLLSYNLEELCLSETNLGGRDLLELRHLKKLQFLKLTGDFFEFEQLTFEPHWFCTLQRLCFDVPKVPKIVLKEHAMEGLESLQLVCNELGGVSGILNLKQLKEVMLSTRVSGAGADDLLKQVSKHSMKPKLLYADGSSRHMLLQ